MSYYHVYIAYTDKKGKEDDAFSFDQSEDYVKKFIADPYMKNKPFMIIGKVVYPSDIHQISIYESEKEFQELILPNGKSPTDFEVENIYIATCFDYGKVKDVDVCTWDFITSPPEEKEPKAPELAIGLMKSASFLGLNTNWSLATCALQLQEVAVTLVAEKKKIKLDKTNVERILNKKITGELSFNDRYRAFSKQVKALFKIDMPRLTTHLRRMRTEVLHQGYNPTPEETESIASFTIGLLKKLKDIS